MTSLVTENLPLVSRAPSGIARLRELILDLAVRGALAAQGRQFKPNESRLTSTQKADSTHSNSSQSGGLIEAPFVTPSDWRWAKLGDIAVIERGGSPRPIKDFLTTDPDGLNWIKIGDTEKGGKYITAASEKIRRDGLKKTRMVYPGDFLLTNSMSFGRPYITQIVGCIHDGWLRISPPASLDRDYLYSLLSSPYVRRFFERAAAGAVVMNLNADKVRELPVPLPPIDEQHRIVAKVDELMALCDRLEAEQADSEAAHAKLVEALLASLTQARDVADFRASWQQLAEHFHTLFTTDESVDALKAAVVQLGVMGKLVPQGADEGAAASDLIRLANSPAMRAVRTRKAQETSDVEAPPFRIPGTWVWTRIGQIATSTEYGLSEKTTHGVKGAPVLKMGDIQRGKVLLETSARVPQTVEGLPDLYLEPGDLLYNRTNSADLVGKTGLFMGPGGEYTFASYLIRVRFDAEFVSSRYINYVMNSPLFRETQINPHLKQQCGQANVNGTVMKNMLVSLPPLAEQHRIVAKVDELLSLCDQLKQNLATARQSHEHLASSLVEQAVA